MHPYLDLELGYALVLEIGLFAAIVAVASVMRGRLTVDGVVPHGIVSLQLALTRERAREILDAWRGRGLLGAARRNVRIDFLFLVLYAEFLAVLSVLAGRAAADSGFVGHELAADLGTAFAIVGWSAGGFDFLENLALLMIIPKPTTPSIPPGAEPVSVRQPWPLAASLCASLKIACIVASALFALVLLFGSL